MFKLIQENETRTISCVKVWIEIGPYNDLVRLDQSGTNQVIVPLFGFSFYDSIPGNFRGVLICSFNSLCSRNSGKTLHYFRNSTTHTHTHTHNNETTSYSLDVFLEPFSSEKKVRNSIRLNVENSIGTKLELQKLRSGTATNSSIFIKISSTPSFSLCLPSNRARFHHS